MESTPAFLKWMLGIGVGLIGYLAPVSDLIAVVVVAISLDLVTGLWASLKTGKGWKSLKLLSRQEGMLYL